jgi:hypothetical protein
MTTLLDEPTTAQSTSPAHRLRTSTAAVRLSFTWFGTRKTLSPAQKSQAAESFGAEGDVISAGKKLIDTRDPLFRAVTSVRSQAGSYFKGISLPYPEPGIRLIRQGDLDEINLHMGEFKDELVEAVRNLDGRFDELKSSARQRLGDLFNQADYPASLLGLFDMAWDFPSVEPPDYLQRLNPQVYQQECQRVQARFDEAVRLAEAAFMEELAKLVEHLAERLSGQVDGKPKVFRDSVTENLTEFFQRFQNLNVGSNEELDSLVERAQQIVRGVQPQQLRDSGALRQQVATELAGVQSVLDGLLVDRPRRNILRRPR